LCLFFLGAANGSPPAAPPAAVPFSDASTQRILAALKQELARSMSRLRLRGYEAPYFISYTLRDVQTYDATGKFGALFDESHDRQRTLRVEVRVGSYDLDNTSADESDAEGELMVGLEVSKDAPLDDDLDALRGGLWLLTDQKYKQALSAYARKRARGVKSVEPEDKLPSFSREPPEHAVLSTPPFVVNAPALAEAVRQAGARLKQAPVLDGEVKLSADRHSRYYVSSEGAEVVEHYTLFNAHLTAETRAKDGMPLSNSRDFFGPDSSALPPAGELAAAVDGLVQDLAQLQVAPTLDPYTGPAILMEEAAGVFFHETIGHRLEGERQVNEQEGRTFKGQLGKRVLPDFLSVYDDPTIDRTTMNAGGAPPSSILLNGFYRYDDEGVPARAVSLIERGVLRNYLKSRTPVLGALRSNGHGRADGSATPMGRMANLIVKSSHSLPLSQLKAQLIEEVRRQGKPYGLIIRDILGGSTNTHNYGTQTFRGQPTMVYRVDARTGEESLVRGVEMVGTPLSSVAKIVATSDTAGVFNGYWGAEFGMVPVSTVAPAVLFTEIELQRTQNPSERPPILPPPWRETESAPKRPAAGR
jgi:predicted Zn-dependent protease